MKKFLISIGLLCVGLFCGSYIYNHFDAWIGIAVTLITIGVFLNYIYKQFDRHLTDQLKNNNDEKV